jgi:hypothetical protein
MSLETDVLLRCYPLPNVEKLAQRRHSKNKGRNERQTTTAKHDAASQLSRRRGEKSDTNWFLVFDTETTTDTRQALRFGIYHLYGMEQDEYWQLYRQGLLTQEHLDASQEIGIFYNPDELSDDEIATIHTWAHARHIHHVMTREEFVTDAFYRYGYFRRALIIGHNLPFDISRLATKVTQAGGGRGHATSAGAMTTDFYGGFSLKLCQCHADKNCLYHPSVRVKQFGSKKAFIAFQKVPHYVKAWVHGDKTRRKQSGYTGKFLDTATLGLALLGPGDTSLKGMGKRFQADILKTDTDEHGDTLTDAYLTYAVQDVEATWALYRAERDLYNRHGLSTPIWRIYSEASLGKAYWREMGVPPFMQAHPDFPPEVIGYAMTAYYGGRSECHCRLQPVEVIYTDFKSQYPTVNALLRLQDILLAKEVTTHDATADVRAWLAKGVDQLLADMLNRDTWPRLRVLVNISPHGDILPVRAHYRTGRFPDDSATSLNIGVNYLTSDTPLWYTLADVASAVLLTGKTPDIIEAIEIVPSAEQVTTRPLTLFGDDRYQIDLSRADFFTRVIDMRGEVKQEMKRAEKEGRHDDAANLDGLQVALKLLANSTAYGALMEVNPDEPTAEKRPVTVYGLRMTETTSDVLEWPGSYFAGPLGAFITAGGRLLLAMAEKMAADRGISYDLCDTDSMAFARPDGMARDTFAHHVHAVIDAFTPLSPYQGQPPILECEDENEWEGKPEPLYALAVSTKRYALYNKLSDGTIRIRKFTHHGLGTWQLQERDGFTLPAYIPPPCAIGSTGEPDSYPLGGPLWSYALWNECITTIETGTYPDGEPLLRDERGAPLYIPSGAWLDITAFHRLTVSTWELYERYRKYIPDLLPFSFINVLPGLDERDCFNRIGDGRPDRNAITARYAEQRAAALFLPARERRYQEIAINEQQWNEYDAEQAAYQERQAIYQCVKGKGAFIAPYARNGSDLHDIRLADNPSLNIGDIRHKTLQEMLRDYFRHGEPKTADPQGMGYLPRRHVVATGCQMIGKETNRKALVSAEETDGIMDGAEAGMDGAANYGRYAPDDEAWRSQLEQADNISLIAKTTGITRQTLYNVRSRRVQPTTHHLKTLRSYFAADR